ncbi:MAG TPA: hypothetical protein VMB72_11785 [Acidimicrobiales bacterium]|nr:hypothetical protein [Acidimicrobiales bacterium]
MIATRPAELGPPGRSGRARPGQARRRPVLVALAVVAALGAACGGASPGTHAARELRAPLPAGHLPSPIAKMVCAAEAQREIADALGVTAVVQRPTWVGHRYTCVYRYPDGSFVMSVQELSSWDQTYAFFRSLGRTMGDTGTVRNLGQAAFTTTNGSVVVRKDWKVLLVDIAGLPPTFGVPATSSPDVALTIADVILGCWDGD